MKMKFSTVLRLALVGLIGVGFSGCLPEDEEKGSNSVDVSIASDRSSFEVKMNVKNVGVDGDYYHVSYALNSTSRELFSYGANYSGTVTTTCTRTAMTGTGDDYYCVTSYDTESPVGDPDDKTDNISLSDSTTYSVVLTEYSFSGNKETVIGSL